VRSFSSAALGHGGLVDGMGRVRRDATDRLYEKFRRDE
jgi:hypothetical protein